MSLNFILGRAGSGKTYWCLESLRTEMAADPLGPPLILLVPEQATHQTERALLAGMSRPAAVRARILSFRRLAAEVLAESGLPAAEILDATGRQMLLAAVLAEVRPRLRAFAGTAGHAGFVGRLSLTLGELAAQCASSPALRKAEDTLRQGGGSELLQAKAHDVALVLDHYRARLQQHYLDPQDTLELATFRLAGSGLLRGATVWVDGFAGFTPQEYELLMAIANQAATTWVALCLDPADLGSKDVRLFRPTIKTYWQLRTAAAGAAVPTGQLLQLPLDGKPTRFARGGALAYLESAFSAPATGIGATPGRVAGPGQDGRPCAGETIRLIEAPDRRTEVAAAAADMVRLCREQGYAWRDMAVIVAGMAEYHDLLRTTLADYGVPYFIDRRRPVPHHPVVELLRSTLEIAAGNWPTDAVFRWLKTDLSPLDRGAVDELENYVLEHGLRGSVWTQDADWRYWPRSLTDDDVPGADDDRRNAAREGTLAVLDRSRRIVAALLAPTCDVLASARRAPLEVSRLVEALVDLLKRAEVPTTLAKWAEDASAAGDLDGEQEHLQVWRGVCGVLEGAHAAMGAIRQDLTAFAATLQAGLAALTLGLVPPSLDQVVCGTIERSRQPNLKALFVLGACQGAFPGAPAEDQLFDDRDREALAQAGLKLAETARELSFHEEYLTYIALTRASDQLWVSWPASPDPAGGPGPSPLIARLKSLFADLTHQIPRSVDLACEPAQLVTGVAGQFSGVRRGLTPDAGWRAAYEWLVSKPERISDHASSLRGWQWSNQAGGLGLAVVRGLWRQPLRGSASRLERFMTCPFSHFAAYGLALAPRPRQQIRAPEMGSFYHAVLQAFFQGLRRDHLALESLSESEWRPRLERETQRIAGRLQSQALSSSGRHRYLARILGRTLHRTIGWLQQHASRSAFRTVGEELGFGLPGSPHGPLQLGEASLRGIIDRLDVGQTPDGRTLLRVIDYKSGRPKFDLTDAAHGISLQLLTYLLAAPEIALELIGPGAQVVALMLFPVQDRLLSVTGPHASGLAAKIAKDWQPSGLMLKDPVVVQMMDRAAGEPSEHKLFGVRLGAKGQVVGSSAIEAEQLDLLQRYLVARVKQVAGRLLRGDVAINPYRRGERRGCDYCDYHALCAFDPQLTGNSYQDLAGLSKAQAWQQIAEIAGEGGGSSR